MLRKTSVAAAVIAFATVGSALFGGVALADDSDGKDGKKPASVSNTGGPGGAGGDVWQECDQDSTAYNIFKPGGDLKDSKAEQNATAYNTCNAYGGAGGTGGVGATY